MENISSDKFNRIIDGWHHFSMMESISSTKININSLNERNSFKDFKNNVLNDNIVFDDKQVMYIEQHYIKREIKDTEEVMLFFPLIQRFIDGKKVGLPLFAIKITNELKNIVLNKVFSFNPNEVNESLHTMKEVFENTLQLPEEELPNGVSLIDFMNELSNSSSNNFEESYEDFIMFLEGLNLKIFSSAVISKGESTYEFKTFSSQMKLIKDIGIQFSPLAKEYLGTTKEDSLLFKSKYWFGGFNNENPLSQGQSQVLLAKQTNNLIPVKGAPGTGKTTLLSSVIAEHFSSTILDKIFYGNLSSSLMVFLSSSNKVVENIEDVFIKDPFFKNRKDFYLFIGNQEKVKIATKRMHVFVDELQKKEFKQEEKDKLGLKIKELISLMENEYKESENLKIYMEKENENKFIKEEVSKNILLLKKNIEDIECSKVYKEADIPLLEEERQKHILLEKIRNKLRFFNVKIENLQKEKFSFQSEINKYDEMIKNNPLLLKYKNFSKEEIFKEISLIKKRHSMKYDFEDTELSKKNIDSSLEIAKELDELIYEIWQIPIYYFEPLFKKRTRKIDLFWQKNKAFLSSIDFKREALNKDKLKDLRIFFERIGKMKKIDIYKIKEQEELGLEPISNLNKLLKIKQSIHVLEQKIQTFKKQIEIVESEKKIEKKKQPKVLVEEECKEKLKELINLKEKINNLDSILNNINIELETLNKITTKNEILCNGNQTEMCRTINFKKNRKLFELLVEYNEFIQIENKIEVIRAVEAFERMITMSSSAEIRSEWAGREDELYIYLAMAFPLLTTTIASFQKIIKTFSDGFYTSAGNWVKWNKIKNTPISLLLSDESGMTKIHALFPPIYYSKKAVIVGDEDQLEPIVSLSENTIEENIMLYFNNENEGPMYSPGYVPAFSRAAGQLGVTDKNGRSIILNEHRRCQPKIAAIFKDIIKDNYAQVEIKTLPLYGERKKKFEKLGGKNIITKNIVGTVSQNNVNILEIEEIEKMLNEIEDAGYNLKTDVGIITPYRGQAKELMIRFSNRLNHSLRNKKIGTLHSFQGSEFEVVILSTVVTGRKSMRFINKKRSLLNVSVSRAKDVLVVVGDIEKLRNAGGTSKILSDHLL